MIEVITPEFIADLYSAVVEPNMFGGLTNLFCRAAGAATGGTWIAEDGNVSDFSFSDEGRESVEAYLAHYHKLDIWQANAARMPRDQLFLSAEHTDESNMLKSDFYNEFARHYGIRRPLGGMVQLRPGTFATFSFDRPFAKKLFDVEDKPNFQRFIPYVKSALQLRLRERENAQRASLYASALDALTFGAVICNARSEIAFANSAAELLAASGAGIILGRRGRGLSTRVPAESRALATLVHATANGGPGGVLRLTGHDGATSILVLVTPLPPTLGGGAKFGHALVSLRSARERPAFVEATLTALFRLSPAQAQIAIALHGGKTPEEIAIERGIKISTLRSHLAEIFIRTGTENQRDLVRLLASLPPLSR